MLVASRPNSNSNSLSQRAAEIFPQSLPQKSQVGLIMIGDVGVVEAEVLEELLSAVSEDPKWSELQFRVNSGEDMSNYFHNLLQRHL